MMDRKTNRSCVSRMAGNSYGVVNVGCDFFSFSSSRSVYFEPSIAPPLAVRASDLRATVFYVSLLLSFCPKLKRKELFGEKCFSIESAVREKERRKNVCST